MASRRPWDVLGVEEDATFDEVQRAFRRQALRTHPDRGGDPATFAELVTAYKVMRRTFPVRHRRQRPVVPHAVRAPVDERWTQVRHAARSWVDVVWRAPLADAVGPGPEAAGNGRTDEDEQREFADVLDLELARYRRAAAPGHRRP